MKAASFTPKRLQLALIALPMALATIYYTLIASDRYVSESIVAVGSASVANGASPLSVGTGTSLAAFADTLYLIDYIQSQAVLRELDAKLKLRDHYSAPQSDLLFRLWPGASQEWFQRYWKARVELEFNDLNGLLKIRTQGFDPAKAEAINLALLETCERFVNEFSRRIGREQMKFSEAELASASARLQAAKDKVVQFQSTHKVLDPQAQQTAANALTAELQATIARLEADLKNKQAFMQNDAPAVQAVRDQIAANRAQLESEKARTTSTQAGDKIGALSVEFQNLQLQAAFAEDAYRSANTGLEAARIEASKKLKSLIVVGAPAKAETAAYPTKLYNLFTILVLCIIVYTVVRLMVAAIREHQD